MIGKEKLSEYTANISFTGFTAPKILWVRNKEPENFARIAKVMLPKDYIAYRLTGVHCTDVSDASGMLLFDVKTAAGQRRCVRSAACDRISWRRSMNLMRRWGTVLPAIADELGIPILSG